LGLLDWFEEEKRYVETARVKFYNMSLEERLAWLAQHSELGSDELAALSGAGGLTPDQADHMIENVIGLHACR
jgi:hydroxymethylglutaryl-CoA reductase